MGRTSGGEAFTRRAFLTGGAGTLALAASGDATAAREGRRVTVELTDTPAFVPEEVTVAPGDTVVWENVGRVGHSVTAYEDEIPDGAEYFDSAGAGSEEAARSASPAEGDIDAGERFEHTFAVEGTHEYCCLPHERAGMRGTVTVDGGVPDAGSALPVVGDSARTLGVAAATALAFVVGVASLLLASGGEDGE